MTTPDLTRLLMSLSAAAQTLSRAPNQLGSVTAVILTQLREVTRVDAAELYLADPPQRHLVRVGHSGADRAAFSQRNIFSFGEGFPGLAAAAGEPLETDRLEQDGRYLRSEVTGKGYRMFLSYPLLTPRRVVGVLNLAAKDARQIAGARQALELIAPLLASNLYAVMTSLGEETLMRVRRAEEGRERALHLLHGHLSAAGGQWAALRSLSGGADVETHPGRMAPCRDLSTCPVREGKVAVSGLTDLTCPTMPTGQRTVCLPLWDGPQVSRILTLQFADAEEGCLGSEMLTPLLWLGRLAAPELGEAAVPPPAPYLQIRTFGGFQVWREGTALKAADFKRRQAYQLLKVLVTRWGSAVHMDELCEALWPAEEVSDKVLARLHVALNALRQVLEPREELRGKVLVRDGAAYRFAPAVPWHLDAAEFETLVHQADALRGAEATAIYTQALELYKGDYLADDPYAGAFVLERDYLRELAVHALTRCAEWYGETGQTQERLTSYAQLLTIDPHRFDAHEALIGLLVSQGRREEAGAYWERYAQAYGDTPPLGRP